MDDVMRKYLSDIAVSIDNIDIHLQNRRDFNFYAQNITVRKAVERELEIIGQAVSRLLKLFPDMPISYSRTIVDLRNRIIHSYDSINETIIWKILIRDMPVLKNEVEALLKDDPSDLTHRIHSAIRVIPDFPKQGINFKDITPILESPQLCADIVTAFTVFFLGKKIDAIVGVESRGFLFGMLIAQKLNIPFFVVRKKGKLPYKTISCKYDLEYGSAEVEMHIDTVKQGWNVLIHDDLLATGGTAAAAAELIKLQGGNVAGFAFLIELSFLNGSQKLLPYSENIVKLVSC